MYGNTHYARLLEPYNGISDIIATEWNSHLYVCYFGIYSLIPVLVQ